MFEFQRWPTTADSDAAKLSSAIEPFFVCLLAAAAAYINDEELASSNSVYKCIIIIP